MEKDSKGPSLYGILVEIRYRHLSDKGFILQKWKLKLRTFQQHYHQCLLGVYTHSVGINQTHKIWSLPSHSTQMKKVTPPPPPIPANRSLFFLNATSLYPQILIDPENSALQVPGLRRAAILNLFWYSGEAAGYLLCITSRRNSHCSNPSFIKLLHQRSEGGPFASYFMSLPGVNWQSKLKLNSSKCFW